MSKGVYIGADGLARKVKTCYIGVNGVARKVKKGYIGVDGVARLYFTADPETDLDVLPPGLYETGTTTLKTSWDDLLANDVVTVTDYVVKKGSNASTETLAGDLVFPADGSVTAIGNGGFDGMSALTGVTFPNTITSIENGAFSDCHGLTEVTIPGSIKHLGQEDGCGTYETLFGPYGPFDNCDGLVTVTIEDGVTAIGDGCFYASNSPLTVIMPKSVVEIGCMAFAYSELTNIDLQYVKTIRHHAFASANITCAVKITADMTLEYTAFYASDITSLTIEDGVTNIPEFCFRSCRHLAGVIDIPASVSSLAASAFVGCDAITGFSVAEDNQNYVSLHGVLFSKDMTSLLTYPNGKTDTSYVVPEGVTTLADDGVLYHGLEHGLYLTDITLPSTLTYIGKNSLYDDHIKTITILATTPPQLGDTPIDTYGDLVSIIVPAGSGEAYKAADGWSKYADYIKEAT